MCRRTYGRVPNAIDISSGSLACPSKHRQGTTLFIRRFRYTAQISRLLRHAEETQDVFLDLNPGVLTGVASHATISKLYILDGIYLTAHRCAGGLKSGFQRHKYSVGYLTCPSKYQHGTNLFSHSGKPLDFRRTGVRRIYSHLKPNGTRV